MGPPCACLAIVSQDDTTDLPELVVLITGVSLFFGHSAGFYPLSGKCLTAIII